MFTANQAARALRPFYFAVHPDLFGSHPEIRLVNEESLKILNGYLDGLFGAPTPLPAAPVSLTFFVRPTSKGNSPVSDSFRRVQLKLNTRDAYDAVRKVLEEFQLSTDDLVSSNPTQRHSKVDWQHFYNLYRSSSNAQQEPTDSDQFMWQSFGKSKKKSSAPSLNEALSKYAKDSVDLSRREAEIQADIKALTDVLCKHQLKGVVADIQWLSGWSSIHRESVLKGLLLALKYQPEILWSGQTNSSSEPITLVFSNVTIGLAANGTYLLGQDEVPQNWLLGLKQIQKFNRAKLASLFDQIQTAENRLSTHLSRRIKFQRPSRTKATVYLQNVRDLNVRFAQLSLADSSTKELLDKQTIFTLSIDDGDYCEPQVSSRGVINIPIRCHPETILNCLESLGQVATQNASKWAAQQERLELLRSQCDQLLKTKVSWDADALGDRQLTIDSLQRLLNSPVNRQLLDGTYLLISHRSFESKVYSVAADGCITVPIDWA